VTEYGFSTKIGDHALTSAVLAGDGYDGPVFALGSSAKDKV
jgi:hypothetical protein